MKKAIIFYIMFSFINMEHILAQYNICDFINRNSSIYNQYVDFKKKNGENYECLDKAKFTSVREQVFVKHTYGYDSNYVGNCNCYIPNTNIFPEYQTLKNGKSIPLTVKVYTDSVKKLMIDFWDERWYGYYRASPDNISETTKCLDSLKYYILQDLDLYTHVSQLAVIFRVPEKVPNDFVFLEKIVEKINKFKELDTVFLILEFSDTKKIEYFTNKLLRALPKEKIKLLVLHGYIEDPKLKSNSKINIVFPGKFPELNFASIIIEPRSTNVKNFKLQIDNSVFTNSVKLQKLEIMSEIRKLEFAKNQQHPNIDTIIGYFRNNNTIEILKHCPNIKVLTMDYFIPLKYPEFLIYNPKLNVNCYEPYNEQIVIYYLKLMEIYLIQLAKT